VQCVVIKGNYALFDTYKYIPLHSNLFKPLYFGVFLTNCKLKKRRRAT